MTDLEVFILKEFPPIFYYDFHNIYFWLVD